jgi:hypothetical protein
MQAPPDDLFQRDSTIPTEDPGVAANRVKQQQQLKKEQAALEAQEKKRAAEEAKRVKKDMATPGTKEKAAAIVTADKRELKKHKIRLYYEKLGHKLSSKPPKTLPSDDAAIDELLASIECELHSNGGIEQAGTAYLSGMAAIEQLTAVYNPLGLQLSGPAASLSSTVSQNKEKWDELITEFAISNAEWFMIGPGKRLLMFTMQMVMAVDGANKAAIGMRRNASAATAAAAEALIGKDKEEA